MYSCEHVCSGKVSQHINTTTRYAYFTVRYSNVTYEYTTLLLLMPCVLRDTPYEMSGLFGKVISLLIKSSGTHF